MNRLLRKAMEEQKAIERRQLRECFYHRVESWQRQEEHRKLMLKLDFEERVRKHEQEMAYQDLLESGFFESDFFKSCCDNTDEPDIDDLLKVLD